MTLAGLCGRPMANSIAHPAGHGAFYIRAPFFRRALMKQQTHEHHEQPLVCDGEAMRSNPLKWFFFVPRLAFKLWFGFIFFGSLAVLYVPFRFLLRKEVDHSRAFALMNAWGVFLNVFLLVPVKRVSMAPLPKPPYVICANHGSYLDIVHMYSIGLDFFLFMGKYELLKWPLVGMFFKRMNIAVNRGSRTEAAKALMRAARSIDKGICVSLFPEGTIPLTTPRMKPFKDGAFKLAIEKQVPIVPVTFLDHWKLFGDPGDLWSRGHPGFAHAVRHPYIDTKGMTEADLDNLRRRVHDAIEGPLKKYAPRKNGPPIVL